MKDDTGVPSANQTWQWDIHKQKMEGLLGNSSDKVFSIAGFGDQRINKIFGYILFFDILCFLNFLVLPFRRKEKSAVNSTLD